MTALCVLLIDDDHEVLDLMLKTLPPTIGDREVRWDACNDFDEAMRLVRDRRYDVVASDVYRDQDPAAKTPETGDPKAIDIVSQIRRRRFSPILLFTDGTFPKDYPEGPFIKLARKSAGNDEIVTKLGELIDTSVPELARQLHDDLDRAGGSYLWGFLESNWTSLADAGLTDPEVLERLLRRRAATQLGRLDPKGSAAEVEFVEGAEFYLYPPISKDYRLGEILVAREPNGESTRDDYRVVLTPHCHLTVQSEDSVPGAEYVLTARTTEATPLLADNSVRGEDRLRRALQSPAGFGKPAGRYWFLPGFLDMEHRYVDFLQLESLRHKTLMDSYKRFAVLDAPFAEALQASFVRFYSAVGLPKLKPERFAELLGQDGSDGSQ